MNLLNCARCTGILWMWFGFTCLSYWFSLNRTKKGILNGCEFSGTATDPGFRLGWRQVAVRHQLEQIHDVDLHHIRCADVCRLSDRVRIRPANQPQLAEPD